MKNVIFSNWNFMRVFRLIIGIAILVQSVIAKDMLFGLAGLLFSGMAVFNIGCCGMGGCYTNPAINSETKKEIDYEEVV